MVDLGQVGGRSPKPTAAIHSQGRSFRADPARIWGPPSGHTIEVSRRLTTSGSVKLLPIPPVRAPGNPCTRIQKFRQAPASEMWEDRLGARWQSRLPAGFL